ncbi:uncharacterized protein CDV56_104106 [Aspergillus thermomutatus]|uniref:ABM domain-containing protein n=1 Tax=Aspergillus thermomutatus TaxID=41047 RepID=A0A397HB88_ASPTH|nr:uncharacterized protein CDV56_104106 [Aspergillus thermomutatus]RHZ59248.1 hypothetical protein CDV56_104106 [Aspergillus thermomutatus]
MKVGNLVIIFFLPVVLASPALRHRSGFSDGQPFNDADKGPPLSVDDDGRYITEKLDTGDICTFLSSTMVNSRRTTWIAHTFKDILAKNFSVDASAFDKVPQSRHYIENTSDTEKLVWIEIYKSDRAVDISLAHFLALTPAYVVATTLKVDNEVFKQIKREKQLLVRFRG